MPERDLVIHTQTQNDNLLKYIIPVTSVTLEDGTSAAKGSEAGGTVIKITGSNFVADETIVFIQNAVNWICDIDEIDLQVKQYIGGDPQNYFIIGTKKYTRRFLDESVSNQIQIDWGIVDGAEIGTAESASSESYLADFATKLESFIPPIEVGKILEHSAQITAISELKYTSTEEISATSSDPTQNSNDNGNIDINDNSENNNENIPTNTDSSDDEIILVSDEGVNEQEVSQNTNTTSSNATIQKAIKQNESQQTIVIAVSVICSLVGVSIIIAGLLYYKKVKLAKLMATRTQKVDNEFFKVDVTEHQLQQQHPEQQ